MNKMTLSCIKFQIKNASTSFHRLYCTKNNKFYTNLKMSGNIFHSVGFFMHASYINNIFFLSRNIYRSMLYQLHPETALI